jgi:hypothetical protein
MDLFVRFLMVLPLAGFVIDWALYPTIGWKIGFVVSFSTFLTYLLNLLSMKELKPTTVGFLSIYNRFCYHFCHQFREELSLVK